MDEIFSENYKLGVIGGGNMAKSILFPLFDRELVDPRYVIVGGNTAGPLEVWAERGCTTYTRGRENVDIVCQDAQVILWAVKPQIFANVVKAVDETVLHKRLHSPIPVIHISIMAGITLSQFTDIIATASGCKSLNGGYKHQPITVRTMPNIGHRVGAGCTVFTIGKLDDANELDVKKIVESLFSPTGICREVPESQINGFGALTGSGVAFMFPVLEALSDGAVKVGIPRAVALEMAAQTMKAAAQLYLEERTHPGPLKDGVCSPGGTTIAGIAELERIGVRHGFICAIDAANKRSEELGKLAQ